MVVDYNGVRVELECVVSCLGFTNLVYAKWLRSCCRKIDQWQCHSLFPLSTTTPYLFDSSASSDNNSTVCMHMNPSLILSL
jgi:hypothetical protein